MREKDKATQVAVHDARKKRNTISAADRDGGDCLSISLRWERIEGLGGNLVLKIPGDGDHLTAVKSKPTTTKGRQSGDGQPSVTSVQF